MRKATAREGDNINQLTLQEREQFSEIGSFEDGREGKMKKEERRDWGRVGHSSAEDTPHFFYSFFDLTNAYISPYELQRQRRS